MSVTLPVDVVQALAQAGLRSQDAEILTVTSDPLGPRALYRVRLDNGLTVKARRLESEEAAARQQSVRAGLPPAFAIVIARSGAVLIEEWIEGRSLAHESPGETLVRDAARLLATLHATPGSGGIDLPYSASTSGWKTLAEARLDQLLAGEALDATAVGALRTILAASDPGNAEAGVTHLDFCGENMVIDHEGHLRVIDNDRICIDALGLDVARVWYRWALAGRAWHWFRDGYADGGGSRDALAQQRFWRIVGVSVSAAFRLRSSRADVSRPLECLRRLAAGDVSGRDPR